MAEVTSRGNSQHAGAVERIIFWQQNNRPQPGIRLDDCKLRETIEARLVDLLDAKVIEEKENRLYLQSAGGPR